MSKNNLLIAIEGIDGVGKNTQALLLKEALQKSFQKEVGFFSFPRYNTPTGKRVRDYLDGKLDELNLLSRAKLYSDDRLAAREEIYDHLFRGNYVVCDRYVDSNKAFQVCMAKIEQPETDYWMNVRDYIDGLEFTHYHLPKPDITFVLNVDVETSQRMMDKRYGGDQSRKDKHESNKTLLELSHETYRSMTGPSYYQVVCNDANGELRSREDIHAEILGKVLELKDQA